MALKPINDVSTDLDDPPALAGRAEYPGRLKAMISETYPDLRPLELEVAPARAHELVVALVRDHRRWKLISEDASEGRVVGVATTPLFRFKDDFVVRIRPGGGTNGCRLDMRSRSRVGKSDLGANAKRIEQLFAAVKERAEKESTK